MDTLNRMNKPLIRVMLVDDHAVVRAGIKRLLEQESQFSVVTEAESGERAYALFGEFLPDVCVIDISMPGMGGARSYQKNNRTLPQCKTISAFYARKCCFCQPSN